ncbi:heavy metal resistance protein CzcC [Pollutimonas subterranea]|uniref:Heavy metal resistance protein CzcC n=1 Tax=Pollutimonas subterranea TaxID=2045210 RepID=A0A2N4TZD5_9BURK|nr:heavy metal resistance protein CzcC [Pollutimonas subterranea]
MVSSLTRWFRRSTFVSHSSHQISLAVLLACAAALIPAPASAASTLTLAQALSLAIERSRQLAAQDFSVSASHDQAIAAGQLPDPVLKVGIENLPINGANQFSITRSSDTMRRVSVMQEMTATEKRELRAQRFSLEAQKELVQKTVTTVDIKRDTASAWLDRYYSEAMAKVIAEQRNQLKLEILAAKGAYRAGRGSQADILSAQSTLALLDDRASEAQRRIDNAQTALTRWVGDAAAGTLAEKPATDSIRLDMKALDNQLEQHPEIVVLTKQKEIAESEARLAKANKSADWSVELAYSQTGPAYANMVSIGLSIPLQWNQKNLQNRELSAKLALVGRTQAERQERLRALIAETRSRIIEWSNVRERYRRYERELIPLAIDRVVALRSAYRGDKANLADVLAAHRNVIDVRIQALQLAADIDRLWAQLNFILPANNADMKATSLTNKDSQ